MVSKLKRLLQRLTHTKADDEFIETMRAALADGVLGVDERHWILERHAQLGASDAWRKVAPSLLDSAIRGAIAERNSSPETEEELVKILDYLELSPQERSTGLVRIQAGLDAIRSKEDQRAAEVRRAKAAAAAAEARSAFLESLRRGAAPAIEIPNVIFEKSEIPWAITPGVLVESKTVRREYQGGSSGVSFRIAKGVTIRTGGHRGRSVPIVEDVAVANGYLIVTSRRIIFSGDEQSHADPIGKVINLRISPNEVSYHVSNRKKPRRIQIQGLAEAEVIMAAIEGAVAVSGRK